MADDKNPTFGIQPGSVAAAFAEAEQAALAAYENEPDDTEAAAPSTEQNQTDDNAEPTDGTADDTQDDATVQEETQGTAAEPDLSTFDPTQWDGTWETLPDRVRTILSPVHKTMERGMHQKFMENAETRKQLEAARDEYQRKLAELQRDPTPSPKGDTPPPPPSSDMTYEEQVAAQDKRDAYFARKAIEEQAKKLPQFQQVEAIAKQQEAAKRVALVQQQPGYTPDVGAAMAQIAESHPYYASLLDTDEGSLVLFQTAKLAVENYALRSDTEKKQQAVATKAAADIKKQAGAAQGAISRSGGTRKATPADNFAKWGFAEAEKAALEAWEAGNAG